MAYGRMDPRIISQAKIHAQKRQIGRVRGLTKNTKGIFSWIQIEIPVAFAAALHYAKTLYPLPKRDGRWIQKKTPLWHYGNEYI